MKKNYFEVVFFFNGLKISKEGRSIKPMKQKKISCFFKNSKKKPPEEIRRLDKLRVNMTGKFGVCPVFLE